MYILIIATHFQYFWRFSKLPEQFYAQKVLKITFFYLNSETNKKISDDFFLFFVFSSSPHVPEDKWHSQKKWYFRLSLGVLSLSLSSLSNPQLSVFPFKYLSHLSLFLSASDVAQSGF